MPRARVSAGGRVEWFGDEVEAAVTEAVSKRLDKAAIMVAESAKASMLEPKSGASMGEFTRRSAPGEAPASQHGEAGLLGSVTWDAPLDLERRVGTNLEYGRELEEGTVHKKARPWLEAALMRERSAIRRMFGR